MITRFAPSPTGPLDLGHAYSAIVALDIAKAAGGTFLLRIEDIDQLRSLPVWEKQIYDDLQWLGLTWADNVMRQSERLPSYKKALEKLSKKGLIYPCTCSRSDVKRAASAPQEGVFPMGPDGIIYPGTCRGKKPIGKLNLHENLRCDMSAIGEFLPDDITFEETGENAGTITTNAEKLAVETGDFVVSRKHMFTSYHLSVVVDDAAQKITHVVRGADIQDATPIHVALQKLLNLPTPIYHHHRLIRDDQGKRLAKRDDARAISKYRAEGASPNDIRRLVGLAEV